MIKIYIDNFIIFIVLLNPISKILFLLLLSEKVSKSKLRKIALNATIMGMIILGTFAYIGSFILQSILHIDIASLQIAGGIILFLIGLHALQKGEFFGKVKEEEMRDVATVPLASPLIAGPATITASISQSTLYNPHIVTASICSALLVNFLIMLFSVEIGSVLKKYHLMGALIRINGLFIASIGINMVLKGFKF